MCEFCTQHGEGQKWYRNMANYSRELSAEKGSAEAAAIDPEDANVPQ
jgi:hypothetical protein